MDGAGPVVPVVVETPESRVEQGRQRLAALAESMHKIRSRQLDVDKRKAMLVAGSVLAPLGVALVILGWYGAAHSPFLYEQVPYLISGGLLGVTLVIIGGFLYFGFWVVRMLDDNRAMMGRIAETLEHLEAQRERNRVDEPGRPTGRSTSVEERE